MKYMLHKCAEELADICCKRGWIQEGLRPWCIYTLEKWLSIMLFFSAAIVWASFSDLYVETVSFLIPFYSLRRRIGGYHTKNAYFCFFISIISVMIASSVIGTYLLLLPLWILMIVDSIVVIIAIVIRPTYPPQVHFTQKEITANFYKKNDLINIFFAIQLISGFFGKQILAYSLCGISFCITTVIIQKQEWKSEIEKT